jgi:hypothetical protein
MPRYSPKRAIALRSAASGERADLRRAGKERRGLGANEQVVLLLGVAQAIVCQELAHFADRHLVGHPREHPQRLEITEPDQLDDGARIEIVAHDHRHLVTEERVDRRHARGAARMIDRVVVHQGREVDQLHHRGHVHRARVLAPGRVVHQEDDGGPEELALHLQQVRVDVADEREIGGDEPAHGRPALHAAGLRTRPGGCPA